MKIVIQHPPASPIPKSRLFFAFRSASAISSRSASLFKEIKCFLCVAFIGHNRAMSLPYTCSPHHDPTLQVLDAQDEAAEARGVSEDWRVFLIDRRGTTRTATGTSAVTVTDLSATKWAKQLCTSL